MSLYNFYRSKEWENLLKVLKMERLDADHELICEYCFQPMTKAYDIIGHHITELTEENYTDANISLNPHNIMLLHHKCHNKIHNKLGKLQYNKQVYLVFGSPLAGKTSYVNEVKVDGDLIVDLDNIWMCISGCDRYTKPNKLNAIAFKMRDTLLECVKYRLGKWNNAYIIGGYPFKGERDRLIDNLGAREIFIDTPKEECLKRLELDTDRDKSQWENYINLWWAQYSGGY